MSNCPTANQLRAAFYASTTYAVPNGTACATSGLEPAIRAAIVADRQRPEYQIALAALRTHIATCETCRSILWKTS